MKLICTTCPRGCEIEIKVVENSEYIVTGNACKRGYNYAINELTCPKRNFSMALAIEEGDSSVVSVKTSEPVNKAEIMDYAQYLRKMTIYAPVEEGDIIVKGILGSNTDIVAITSVKKV